MRQLFTSILILSSLACLPQKQLKIFDWKTENTLNSFLVENMRQQYRVRSQNFVHALGSKDSLLAYGKNVQQKFRDLLGMLPPSSPLNAKITGSFKAEGYTVQKIVYESFANHHVTANFYIPSNIKERVPAVLMFCGHEDVSKATESYQRTAIMLALHGFAVMVIDPISQSERHQLTDANGKPLTRGGTTEHTLVNETASLVGTSAIAYELWDNIRGLDYLVTRAEVDTARIGCIGNSGGAIQAIYFAAFDPRIKVIVPCSYLSTRERTLELSGPADGCAQLPGEGKSLLEMSDYLIAAAPKPILVLAGRYDFIDYEGTRTAFHELQQAYNVLGQSSKVKLFTYEDGHGISWPKIRVAVSWFRQWFMQDSSEIYWRPHQLASDKELFATKKGQVNAEFPNEITVFSRNRMLADSLAALRRVFLQQHKDSVYNKISELLQAARDSDTLYEVPAADTVTFNGVLYSRRILHKRNMTPLGYVFARPEKTTKIIYWFPENGKQAIIDSPGLVRSYLNQGAAVIICEVCGTGETSDRADMNDPKYLNREYRNAMLSLHIGNSLVNQRLRDMLVLMREVEYSKIPVEIHASGPAALSALHFAYLRRGVSKLYLYNCIKSFKDILNNPMQKDWYSWVIPGVLKYYDIPDLVKLTGEDKVIFVK
jgi:dienelactone hydrolase